MSMNTIFLNKDITIADNMASIELLYMQRPELKKLFLEHSSGQPKMKEEVQAYLMWC